MTVKVFCFVSGFTATSSARTGKREERSEFGEENGEFVVEVRCPVCRGLGVPVWSMGKLDRQLQTCESAAPQWWLKAGGGVRSAWEIAGSGGSAS